MQLDALSAAGCLKVYTDTATGTKADRPQWIRCLEDLRPGDTLVIWKIDRLGRNLRDLIDIVTTLETTGVGPQAEDDRRADRQAQRMYNSRQFTMAGIAASCGVTPMTVYRHIRTDAVDGGKIGRPA